MDSVPPSGLPKLPELPDFSSAGAPQLPISFSSIPSDIVEFTVPVRVPKEMTVPDKDGKTPLDEYEVQLVPKDAIVTNQGEVQELVQKVKEETLPPGTRPELVDSSAGMKVGKVKTVVGQLGQMAGGFGNLQLMGSNPAAWAAPAAIAGGAIGFVMSMDNLKKAYDSKQYYESLKAQGKQFIQVPIQTRDGKVIVQNVNVDDLITGSRDAIVTGWAQTVGSALMMGAGLGGGPIFAIGAMAIQIGAFLYAARHALKAVAQKAGKFLKDKMVAVKDRLTGKTAKDEQEIPALPDMQNIPAAKAKQGETLQLPEMLVFPNKPKEAPNTG